MKLIPFPFKKLIYKLKKKKKLNIKQIYQTKFFYFIVVK